MNFVDFTMDADKVKNTTYPLGVLQWQANERKYKIFWVLFGIGLLLLGTHIVAMYFMQRKCLGVLLEMSSFNKTYNLGLCLSRWNKHLKNQARQLAAAMAKG